MGFSSGMAVGAGIARTAEEIVASRRRVGGGGQSGFTTRPSMASPEPVYSTKDPMAEALVTAEYQKSRQDLAQLDQQQAALNATKGMESARLAKIDIDETRARGEKNATEQQARDFQMSAASLSIGDTSLAEEYINNYGDPRMKISLRAEEGGKIVATPNGGTAPMTFDNARNFYASFFGQLRPKGSDFALPAGAEQDWKMSIEDGRAFKIDSKSGRTEKVDSWETGGGSGGSGGLPAEAKLIDYYITQHGMSKEAAREEAKRAKDSPRKWAGDHYRSLVKLESERLLKEGEVRRTPEELQKQAMADAEYFFVNEKKPVGAPPPLSGMAFAPSLARPPYNGPVPAGAAAGMAAPAAKAPMPAKVKPAPDVVISQARAALQAKIPRGKVMARMEELYPGLSQQL